MVEEKVDEEFVSGHFDPELSPEKGKSGSKLQQKSGDMADQCRLDVTLMGLIPDTKKIEMVGIFQDLYRQPGLMRGQSLGEVCDC